MRNDEIGYGRGWENMPVMISKELINDRRLSWSAIGVMAYMLSKPDNWAIDISEIASNSLDSEEEVESFINELVKFGYLTRTIKEDK